MGTGRTTEEPQCAFPSAKCHVRKEAQASQNLEMLARMTAGFLQKVLRESYADAYAVNLLLCATFFASLQVGGGVAVDAPWGAQRE